FPALGFRLAAFGRDRFALAAWPLFVLCWAGTEFIRSYILTGFPWALPGYVWVNASPGQLASVIGPYGLTLLTIAAASAPATRLRWRAAPLVATAACLSAAFVWGGNRVVIEEKVVSDAPIIRIVQPNFPQTVKWDIDKTREHFDILLDLTRAGDLAPSVVVWPESAVTFPLDMAPVAVEEMTKAARGGEIAVGSLRVNGGPAAAETPPVRWRNSLFLVRPDGVLSEPFDKMHLVPFGEYLPFDAFFRSLGILAVAGMSGGLVPGEAHALIKPREAPAFAPLICYEMIFPREVMAAAEAADWLILATNDAWFGSWWGPEQHLAQAQMRAIETGKPIARSANTGISAMITPYGEAMRRIEMAERGYSDVRLPKPVRTLYATYGEALTIALIVLLVIPAFSGFRRGRAD
ncbi:MAG: apolipoprotein N-acyltransferase, partial [Pseudomonadota bacterium]